MNSAILISIIVVNSVSFCLSMSFAHLNNSASVIGGINLAVLIIASLLLQYKINTR